LDLNTTLFKLPALQADCTNPDGWWYDGGGVYRHVWLTIVPSASAFIAPWGVYAPSKPTGTITWTGGAPFADSQLTPSVEVWNNGTTNQVRFGHIHKFLVVAACSTRRSGP
jgi:hypothetical protein